MLKPVADDASESSRLFTNSIIESIYRETFYTVNIVLEMSTYIFIYFYKMHGENIFWNAIMRSLKKICDFGIEFSRKYYVNISCKV